MSADHQSQRLLDTTLFAIVGAMLAAASVSIAASQITLGLALALLVAGAVAARRRPPRLGLERPSVLLVAWALLMVPLSTAPQESMVYFRRFFLFAALWVAAAAAGGERNRALLMVCLVGGAALAGIGGQVATLAGGGGLFGGRAVFISNAMTSGAVLMMVGSAALAVVLQRGLGPRVRIAAAAAALPVLLGLAQTMTRSAWLGMACSALVMILLVRPRVAPAAGLLVAVVAAVLLVAPEGLLPDRMAAVTNADNVTAGPSTTRRLEMWRGGLAIVRDRPLTGVGDRDLQEVAPHYYGNAGTHYHGHFHNDLVMFAVIWGLPGFVLAVLFVVAQLVVLLRRWRALLRLGERAPPWAAAWALAGLGVWCGLGLAGLFEWYFGDAETQLMRLAIVGAALGGLDTTSAPAGSGTTGATGLPDAATVPTDADQGANHV